MTGLEGKRVVVTRAPNQADALCAALEAARALPLRVPAVAICFDESTPELDTALRSIDTFGWTIFTSANAARAVNARVDALGLDRTVWRDAAVAAIGEATADSLREAGFAVRVVPDSATTDAIVALLGDVRDRSILLPQSDIARPALAQALAARGATVRAVVAYRTVPEAPVAAILADALTSADAFTFASPSAVTGLVRGLSVLGSPVTACEAVVSIGPATTAALIAAGFAVDGEAKEPSVAGLVQALEVVFAARPPRREAFT